MRFKKIVGVIHLWLGLSSGIIVCFLGITGCMLVFQKEIESLTIREQFVQTQSKPYAAPSLLKQKAETALGGNRKIINVEYPGRNKAAIAYYYNTKEYYLLYLNPYRGDVLKVKNMNRDFFRIVLNGHYYLWLPPKWGQPIAASATLVFVVLLITGLILWFPKNKAARKQRFTIKWKAKWRRVNYDLHNVPGFYTMLIALCLSASGLVMGFQWFAKTVYFVSSGGKAMPPYQQVFSDTSAIKTTALPFAATDVLFQKIVAKTKEEEGVSVDFPQTKDAPAGINSNHRQGTYYKRDALYFDQYTLEPINVKGVYAGKYANASAADKLQRMNYDIHVGAIGGLPTKILAFFGSFVAASLPVTGFLLWRGRKKKMKPEAKRVKALAVSK